MGWIPLFWALAGVWLPIRVLDSNLAPVRNLYWGPSRAPPVFPLGRLDLDCLFGGAGLGGEARLLGYTWRSW
jgi:hypothetical protein